MRNAHGERDAAAGSATTGSLSVAPVAMAGLQYHSSWTAAWIRGAGRRHTSSSCGRRTRSSVGTHQPATVHQTRLALIQHSADDIDACTERLAVQRLAARCSTLRTASAPIIWGLALHASKSHRAQSTGGRGFQRAQGTWACASGRLTLRARCRLCPSGWRWRSRRARPCDGSGPATRGTHDISMLH